MNDEPTEWDFELARALTTSPLLLPFVREFFKIEAHVIALRESVAAAETEVEALRAKHAALRRTPATCPTCGGAGIVDTSPPGVDRAPWLATDTDGGQA